MWWCYLCYIASIWHQYDFIWWLRYVLTSNKGTQKEKWKGFQNTNNGKPNEIMNAKHSEHIFVIIVHKCIWYSKCCETFYHVIKTLFTVETCHMGAHKVYHVMIRWVIWIFKIKQRHSISQGWELFEKRYSACVA